jgi:hypothetical protein
MEELAKRSGRAWPIPTSR